eukprot:gb/GFBE01029970.1/.p1 GENE.gb/GFBE01029970.1/~~gb/GFBE01029970.1/.p1  ORF type:complete len:293 (+),score=44.42 gb/GFBE01029970.1/:1-879(+)
MLRLSIGLCLISQCCSVPSHSVHASAGTIDVREHGPAADVSRVVSSRGDILRSQHHKVKAVAEKSDAPGTVQIVRSEKVTAAPFASARALGAALAGLELAAPSAPAPSELVSVDTVTGEPGTGASVVKPAEAPAPAPAAVMPPAAPAEVPHRISKENLYALLVLSSGLGLLVVWRQAKVLLKPKQDLKREVERVLGARRSAIDRRWMQEEFLETSTTHLPPNLQASSPPSASSATSSDEPQVTMPTAKAAPPSSPSDADEDDEASADAEADAAGGGVSRRSRSMSQASIPPR